jgi:hypothetical protein
MRRVIIISTSDEKLFLGAEEGMQDDPSGTVGKLKVVEKPYHWFYNRDNRITTTDGQFVWDRYEQESPTVYLYHRVTTSPMQLFPLDKKDLLHLKMGIFRVVDVWNGDESIVLQGGEVTFRCMSKPGGKFHHPVFFASSAKLSKKQFKAQPTLLMHDGDWKYAQQSTHPGAFGSDHDVYKGTELRGKWIVVWKFPKDLNWISGYQPIFNVALPVGAYSFLRDNWDKDAPTFTHSLLPVDDEETIVEKLRTDFAEGPSVHLLKNLRTGCEVAMISSQYFIESLLRVTKLEKKNVQKMLRDLYTEGIYAFPCFSQHHAIVFYIDKTNEKLLSPTNFGKIIRSGTRGKRIRVILQQYAIQKTRLWTLNYAKLGDNSVPRKYVTYNVAHGVMTHEAGWEVEVVVPCINAHGIKKIGGLTACARLGVELLASQSPEVIGIQEFASLTNGKDWVRYLRKVSGRDYQLHMDASQGGELLCAIVWESLGSFRPLYTKDPMNSERCVAIYDEEAKLVIVSIHVSHRNARNGIKRYVESLWDSTMIRPDHIVLMGDFNDDVNARGCNSMNLWGKTVTLRNPGMRTCCADEERPEKAYPLDYPHTGDYFYTTDSMIGEATLVQDRLLRTSDHRAVTYNLS